MSNNKNKILIAGHSGFIGQHLSKHLKYYESTEIIFASRANGIDLTNSIDFNSLKCSTIVNLSGALGIDSSWKDPEKFYKNNYLTTLNLLEVARKNNASFIQLSSYVYGVPEYLPIDEGHRIEGYNPYASSKILSEQLCIDYSNYYNFPVSIIRPFNLYGKNQSNKFLITQLIESALDKSNIDIYDMNAKRDYLWVGDLVEGIVKVIKGQKENLNIYNIGSGKSYSANEIIKIISKYIPRIQEYVIDNKKKLLIQNCVCDNSLFSKDFNWKPKINIENGIVKIIENLK